MRLEYVSCQLTRERLRVGDRQKKNYLWLTALLPMIPIIMQGLPPHPYHVLDVLVLVL